MVLNGRDFGRRQRKRRSRWRSFGGQPFVRLWMARGDVEKGSTSRCSGGLKVLEKMQVRIAPEKIHFNTSKQTTWKHACNRLEPLRPRETHQKSDKTQAFKPGAHSARNPGSIDSSPRLGNWNLDSTSNPAFGRRMGHGLPSAETVGHRARGNPQQSLASTQPRRAFGANFGHANANAMPSWPGSKGLGLG